MTWLPIPLCWQNMTCYCSASSSQHVSSVFSPFSTLFCLLKDERGPSRPSNQTSRRDHDTSGPTEVDLASSRKAVKSTPPPSKITTIGPAAAASRLFGTFSQHNTQGRHTPSIMDQIYLVFFYNIGLYDLAQKVG